MLSLSDIIVNMANIIVYMAGIKMTVKNVAEVVFVLYRNSIAKTAAVQRPRGGWRRVLPYIGYTRI